MIKTVYLVIGADKSVRAAIRPRLSADEIAITVRLRFPDTWGRVQSGVVDVEVPDFAPSVASVAVEA